MYEKKADELLLATLAADSYCLGSHWVYDTNELKNLNIDWEGLNAPSVSWHEGKIKGDFTHYGDHIVILNDFLTSQSHFDVKAYMRHWREAMETFKGYVDSSTKDTIKNIDNKQSIPCGSTSGDMSVIGRIAPLLKISDSKEAFMENTKYLAQATHNNEAVLEAMHFFSALLLKVLEGNVIRDSILELKAEYSQTIQGYITQGIASKGKETFSAISTFGSSCPTEFSFPSVIHILFTYDDYKEALIQNAKAGGDSSARAMILSYLMVAQDSITIVPKAWLAYNAQ